MAFIRAGKATDIFSLVADPNDPNVVYVGGDRQPGGGNGEPGLPNASGAVTFGARLFRGDASLASGSQWQPITDNFAPNDGAGGAPGTAPHADSRDMLMTGNTLLEVDDGGLYRLPDASAADRTWESQNDNLALTEFYSVAYHEPNDVILGGAQDNGVGLQQANGSTVWDTVQVGDGGIVQTAGDLLYYSTQNFGGFTVAAPLVNATAANANSFVVPASAPFVVGDLVFLIGEPSQFAITSVTPSGLNNSLVSIGTNNFALPHAAGSPAQLFPALAVNGSGGTNFRNFDRTVQFIQEYAANAVNGNRLLIGTNFLYESTDHGRTLTLLNGTPVAGGGNFSAPGAAGIGTVRALVYGGRQPDGLGGFTDQPEVAYVGTSGNAAAPANQHSLWVRPAAAVAGASLVAETSFTTATGSTVTDIAVDPNDWRNVYVLDAQGGVWFSSTGGTTPGTWTWTPHDAGLSSLPGTENLQSIGLDNSGGTPVVLVGGEGGVFRKIGNGVWSELGGGIPNTLVTDIDRVSGVDDLVLLSTLGRGAWTVGAANQTLAQTPTLTLTGSAANNVFHLERNAEEPWLLDVFQFLDTEPKPLAPTLRVPNASLESIIIDGQGGNDDFIIDFSNGVINPVGGISIQGGSGSDQLDLLGPTGDPAIVTFSSGIQSTGADAGIHVVSVRDAFGVQDTQLVEWAGVESVQDGANIVQDINLLGAGLEDLALALAEGLSEALRGQELAGH